MKNFTSIIHLLLIVIIVPCFSFSQNIDSITIRYANSVITYSSEYSKTGYSANQILGFPDAYPDYGDNSAAWASYTADSQREFIELKYKDAEPIQCIALYETYHPGSVDTIYVNNPLNNEWVVVWSGKAEPLKESSRIFVASFPMTKFNVNQIRIAVNSPAVGGWNEIDAVAISDSTISTK